MSFFFNVDPFNTIRPSRSPAATLYNFGLFFAIFLITRVWKYAQFILYPFLFFSNQIL